MVDVHYHNGIDCNKLNLKESILYSPQSALTPAEEGTLSSGGSNDLKTDDATIINNLITRVNELETKLQTLGLLQ